MSDIPSITRQMMQRYGLVFAIVIIIGAISFFWGRVVVTSTNGKKYYFYALSSQGVILNGFWCDCPNNNPNPVKWSGAGHHNDCTTTAANNDKGRQIPGINLPTPPTNTSPGAISCCKNSPKVVVRNSLTSTPSTKILINSPSC